MEHSHSPKRNESRRLKDGRYNSWASRAETGKTSSEQRHGRGHRKLTATVGKTWGSDWRVLSWIPFLLPAEVINSRQHVLFPGPPLSQREFIRKSREMACLYGGL